MRKVCQRLALFVFVVSVAGGTPLLSLTGTTLKPFQVNGWANCFYWQTTKGYSWTDEEYQTLPDTLRTTAYGADVLAGVGLPFGSELRLVAPVQSRTKGSNNSAGLGDVNAALRYGVLQGGLMPVKLAVGIGTSLPTTAEDAVPPISDRTLDFGLGAWANTMQFGPLVGHLRLMYWLNGKTDDTTKVGNMLEYLVDADFALSKTLIPQVALVGYVQNKKQVNGQEVDRTQLRYNAVSLLLMYKPLPLLTVRPKVSVPLATMSQGGAIPDYILGLDVWVTFP
ncbi:MAG: transporter [candidate division WOR-3 bacterium]